MDDMDAINKTKVAQGWKSVRTATSALPLSETACALLLYLFHFIPFLCFGFIFLSNDRAQHEREGLGCISFPFLSSALNAHVGCSGASTAKKSGVICGFSLFVWRFIGETGLTCGIFFFVYFFVLFVCRVRRPFLLRTRDMVTLWPQRPGQQVCHSVLSAPCRDIS